ncbi:MAG TPA: class I tRNA ligase family protein, partial [Chitinophagales bacterium]|nr:class I tRNA ligase family protein [Chitinophagales bacterium]
RLLDGLNTIDWSESLKDQQRNWIGRSEGALLQFHVPGAEFLLEVFTTRIDTLFGATFLVVAPEHEYMQQLITDEQRPAMEEYLAYVGSRSDIQRQQEKAVTGCFTGSYAEHPFTGIKIPIWTAEYVLAGYGTGAIMAVPADDERDRKFAEKFGLTVIEIIDKTMYEGATIEDKVGKMINSDFLNGMEVKDAIEEMIKRVEEMNIGKRQVNYKLRDASYSRQRYWGEPFPIKYEVHGDTDSPFVDENENDEADIPVGLDESQLPVELPQVESYKPSGDGRSPLATNADWVAKNLETDTMPGYAGSSWYYFRYMDPQNNNAFAGKEAVDYWQNVDVYFGGSEHAVGHLLYSRFWHKVLFDLGYAPTEEPFKKLVNQGMIQGVSSIIYRIDIFKRGRVMPLGLVKIDHPMLFITKEFNDLRIKGDVKAIEKIFDIATKYDSPDLRIDEIEYTTTSLKVDISIVNNDQLDIEKYKVWRPESADAIFVTNEQGTFVCGSEVEKMSKSKYNVVNPDDVIAQYGADCFRMFE